MRLKTKGIVLSETPYSETSKILNILTEDFGLIGVISKGCRNIKSKLRGISNKLNYCEYVINYKDNTLSTLIEGEIIDSLKNIYTDIKKASASFYIIDIVYQVLKDNNNKELFYILKDALVKINDGLDPKLICIIVKMNLLKYLGVSINLDCCINCGNNNDLYTIDMKNGGIICKNCYHDGYVFSQKALNLLRIFDKVRLEKLEKLVITDEDIIQEIDDFIYEYYSNYTGIYLKNKLF